MRGRRVMGWTGLLVGVTSGAALFLYGVTESTTDSQDKLQGGAVISARGQRRLSVKDTFAISGTVTDANGIAIERAAVCVTISSEIPFCAMTESDGSYELASIPPKRYRVKVGAPGYHPDHRIEDLRDRRTRFDVDFVLSNGGAPILGRIEDRIGGPIAGALVSAQELTDLVARERGGIPVQSRVDGSYQLWGPEGSVCITAEADGYLPATEIGIAPGNVDLRMTPESALTGRVVELGTQRSVPGVEVSVHVPQYGSVSAGWESSSRTDAEGRFTLRRLAPGRYMPSVSSKGWIGVVRQPVLVTFAQTVNDVLVEVEHAFRVSGRFLTRGEPVVCATGSVTLVNDDRYELPRYESVLPDGRFEFEVVAAGRYSLEYSCNEAVGLSTPVRVESDITDLEIEVEQQPMAVVRGLVVDDSGAPAKSVTVAVRSRDRLKEESKAQTDSNGAFRLSVAWSGEAEIGVRSDPWQATFENTPIVRGLELGKESGPVRIVTVRRGTIRGRTLTVSGEPIVNARLEMIHEEMGREIATGGDGRFIANDLYPGTYRFLVMDRFGSPLLQHSGSDGVQVLPGTIAEISLVVEDLGGWIAGHVVDSTGAPVPDASVTAVRAGDSSAVQWKVANSQTRSELSGADGSFRIDGLAPGAYAVFAERVGSGFGTLMNVVTNETVTIEMTAAGSVAGHVQLVNGSAPKKFRIQLEGPTAPYGLNRFASFARNDGRFRIDDLRPGEYTLIVEAPEGTGTAQASIKSGIETDGIVVRIESRTSIRGQVLELASQQPAAGVTIQVRSHDTRYFGIGRSEEDGAFQIAGVPVGVVEIHAPASDTHSNEYLYVFGGWMFELTPGDLNVLPPIYVRRSSIREGDKLGRFGFTPHWSAGEVVVREVIAGLPAARAGLRAGDVITHVDGIDVTGPHPARFWLAIASREGQHSELRLRDGRVLRMTAVSKE